MAEQKPATQDYLATPKITVEAGYNARLLDEYERVGG